MPVDPIINLGTPIVQAYLAGLASRRQQEAQQLQQAQTLFGIQNANRDDAFRASQAARAQANTDRGFQNADRTYDLARERMTFDQGNRTADDMRRQDEIDQKRRAETAAQSFNATQFPQLVQSRGMSPDQLWDNAGQLATEETAFRAAPSAVQGQALKPALDTLRDQQIAEAARQRLQADYQRAVDQIATDPRLSNGQRDKLLGDLRAEMMQRQGLVSKHFGDIPPSPEQLGQRMAEFGVPPDKIAAAMPYAGLKEAGLTGEMAQQVMGTQKKTPYTAGLRAQDSVLDAQIRQAQTMLDSKQFPEQEAAIRNQILGLRRQQTRIAEQIAAELGGGVGMGGGGVAQPAPQQAADPIDQAIQALTQQLGRTPTEDEVLQALQGTP